MLLNINTSISPQKPSSYHTTILCPYFYLTSGFVKKKMSLGFLKCMLLSTYGGIYHTLQNININKNNKVLVKKKRAGEERKVNHKGSGLNRLSWLNKLKSIKR